MEPSSSIWGANSILSSQPSLPASMQFGLSPTITTPTSLLSLDNSPIGTPARASPAATRTIGSGALAEDEKDDSEELLNSINLQLEEALLSNQPQELGEEQHPLKYSWTLWFLHRAPGVKISDYEKATKEISSFSTVEDFWRLYSYLIRPSSLPYTSEYHIFKTGVRPIWEDPMNVHGGKWLLKLRKGMGTAAWESLLLAIVGGGFGDQLDEEIVGAVISIRREADIISLWNRQGSNGSVNLKIRDMMRNVLGTNNVTFEYKVHAESLKEGAEKMQASAAAAAAGEKPHRTRGGGGGYGGYGRNRVHSSEQSEREGSRR
ncbi:translation initiation factor eIF 4e-like domain-containing protein [Myxozyma melibiosi]|uniref:Translation initiation factor eIF 4e-like domain-containing protein n=1 Tax=Myxozyma melibiosi TaxID=54550 RepID=A0ABR1F5H7_9ASCO